MASAQLQLSGLRLEAEYVVITLLPPDAFGLAVRLRALLRRPPAALRSGRASRSIDVAAGLTLLLPDGTAEPFAPPEEASTWAGLVSSLLGGGGGGGGGGGNRTRLAGGADGDTGATGWVRRSAAVGVLAAAAAALVARGRRRQRDAASRVVEEETQGFLSLGTADGGAQRSEREGGKCWCWARARTAVYTCAFRRAAGVLCSYAYCTASRQYFSFYARATISHPRTKLESATGPRVLRGCAPAMPVTDSRRGTVQC